MDTTETTSKETIPTPLPLLMRRVRYQVVPILTLVICLSLAAWLWVRRGGSVTAIGSVNAVQITVNSNVDGRLIDLPLGKVEVFHAVTAGEVVARLDSSHIRLQIERETERLNEVRRQLEVLNKYKPKHPTTAPTTGTPANADEAALARLKGSERSAILKAQVAEGDADSELLNNPLLQSKLSLEMMANSYQAKIQELEQRVIAQDIKAPISGTIISIHRFPGQAVAAGQQIMTIASQNGDYIVTYVRQSQIIQPTKDMVVNVHLRSAPRTLRSYVKDVGPQMERIPPEHLRDPRVIEFGLPVHIAIPVDPLQPNKPVKLRPGELVDLFFRPNENRFASAGG